MFWKNISKKRAFLHQSQTTQPDALPLFSCQNNMLLSVEWFVVGNFLFTGIPLFFLGHFFHAKQQIFRAMKGKEIPIILFGLFVTYLEANMLNGTYLSIGQITIVSSLLCLCINNSHIKGGFLAFLGSHCSLYVMLYHCQIRDTAQIFVGPHPFIVALVTLIISISVAIIIDSL